MASSLPQELKEKVVSYLNTDVKGLKACSLAIRGYLACCQRQLLSQIILGGPQVAYNLRNLLAGSPHLAPYVKCIKNFNRWPENWISKDTSLAFILPLLQNLCSFYLHCRAETWHQMHRSLIDCFVDVMKLPSLTHVSVTSVPCHVLNSGVYLKHLSIPGLDAIYPPIPFPQYPAQEPIYLETLYIPLLSTDLVDWFLSPENNLSLGRLKKLNLRQEEDNPEQVTSFLDICQHTLEEFAFEPYIDTCRAVSPLDLNHLVALRALHVRINLDVYIQQESPYNPLRWYIRQIKRLPSSNVIERITIHVIIAGLGNARSPMLGNSEWSDWQTVSTILLEKLSRLRSVDVGIYCCSEIGYSFSVEKILHYAADLQDAGILRLEKLSARYGNFCLYPPYSTWT